MITKEIKYDDAVVNGFLALFLTVSYTHLTLPTNSRV